MKKLVFNFFIAKNWRENSVYNVHFKCLEYYKDCFDEAYFALSLEDPQDLDSLVEVRQKLINIFSNLKRIEFETVENTPYCECPVFKKEVVDRLGQDGLVFFGHLKGVMNIDIHTEEWTHGWIYSLYYLSLNEEYKKPGFIERMLIKEIQVYSYGSFLTEFEAEEKTWSKYSWYYMGTFFWINSKRIKEYIVNNNVQLPQIADLYYAENFLGNLYPIFSNCGFMLGNCYEKKYTTIPEGYAVCWYDVELQHILTTDEKRQEYNNFLNAIKNT